MAVHNAERFLREAVGNILGQTFGDCELLVANDGSTDLFNKVVGRETYRFEPHN